MTPFLTDLNEPQRESIERLRQTLDWCHYVDLIVRKDGQDHHFECDWLSNALNRLCGARTEDTHMYQAILDLRRDIKSFQKMLVSLKQDVVTDRLNDHLNKSLDLLWTILTEDTEQDVSSEAEE